jgi:hypothetical protein
MRRRDSRLDCERTECSRCYTGRFQAAYKSNKFTPTDLSRPLEALRPIGTDAAGMDRIIIGSWRTPGWSALAFLIYGTAHENLLQGWDDVYLEH